jgi:DNA polymerase II large subunit
MDNSDIMPRINSADELMENYLKKAYDLSSAARKKNLDPSDQVEIVPAPDLAARVEGIVGPKGIAEYIRSLPQNKSRTEIAFLAAEAVLQGKFGLMEREKLIEQALRTGTAVLTEGVLVAPTEGIASVKIHQNQDGSEYLAVYYSGPIRSAGGTAAALSVLLADFLRRKVGLSEWRPTDTAVERYLEEIELYDARAARLQYKPSDDEFRHIVRNCPVCVTGDPTEDFEVGAYRNVPGIETNRVRGGMALVLCEGIAQKAAKVLGQARKLGIDWNWLESVVKAPKAKDSASKEVVKKIEPKTKYIEEVVAGRPVIAYPSRFGGFRLRYGRSRLSGLMAKGIHPATMVVLDSFPAIGTQFKFERPGKGGVVTPCESIEPPVVKLKDGSVVRVESKEHAERIKEQIHTILFLGDLLVSYGDFLKSNSPLYPAGYNEEWWYQEVKEAAQLAQNDSIKNKYKEIDSYKVDFDTALRISNELGVPLHPRFVYFWSNATIEDLKKLIEWLAEGEWKFELPNILEPKEFEVQFSPAKVVLEKILVPHKVMRDRIILSKDDAKAVFISLGFEPGNKPDKDQVKAVLEKISNFEAQKQESNDSSEEKTALDALSVISRVIIKDKAGTWIGARMGRPEKSRERHMKPAVHALFPIGNAGGKTRNIMKAYKDAKSKKLRSDVTVEIARMRCPFCASLSFSTICPRCGKKTKPERICTKCGKPSAEEFHVCSSAISAPGANSRLPKTVTRAKTVFYDNRPINIVAAMDEALSKVKEPLLKKPVEEVKCVEGLVSELKLPERLEKGLLRAAHGVSVFKDGTCRVDSTNVPLTHFYPREIGTPVSKLRELGYTKDAYGNDLVSEDQLVELLPHDMVVSERALKYLANVARFIDDELVYLYGLQPFYNLKEDRDLIGHLVITLSPHTSCGIASRIIGTTKAHVCYGHPYIFAASRRDCFYPTTEVVFCNNSNGIYKQKLGEMIEDLIQKNTSKVRIIGENAVKVDADVLDDDIYVMSIDKHTNKVIKKKVKSFIKTTPPEKWVKVTTSTNREFIVTPDHNVVYVENGKLKSIKAENLKEGMDIPLALNLFSDNKSKLSINLVEEFLNVLNKEEKDKIRIHAPEFFKSLKQKDVFKVIGNKHDKWWNSVSLNEFERLIKAEICELNDLPLNARIAAKASKVLIPINIKIQPEFMRILGYYLSEGHCRKNASSHHISFRICNKEMLKDLIGCIEKTFEIKANLMEDNTKVVIANEVLYFFFTKVLKTGSKAKEKRVPSIVFNLPDELVNHFLSAFLDGDGTIIPSSDRIAFYSVSKGLLEDLGLLFSKRGILTRYGETKPRLPGKKVLERYKELKKEAPLLSGSYLVLYHFDAYLATDILSPKVPKKKKAIELLKKKMSAMISKGEYKGKEDLQYLPRHIRLDKTDHLSSRIGDFISDKIKKIEFLNENTPAYCLDIESDSKDLVDKNILLGNQLYSIRCDGDEDAVLLLMDGLLNFSKLFLPSTRGGQMDAPLVMMTKINPAEVDDQVHALEVVQEFPASFYEATLRFAHPSETKTEIIEHRLGKENDSYNLWFTHHTPDINNGVLTSQYIYLKSMKDKISSQLGLAKKIAAVDSRDAAERLIMSHFLPDLYGNLRSFSTQQVRCVDCNTKYRRVPLSGKCTKCGGKLLLTVNRGGIEKYLKVTKEIIEEYNLPNYLRQRILLLEHDIQSIFEDETSKQFNLSEFM